MHDLLDDYAHNNALRGVSSRLKLLLGLASILVCTFSTSPLAPLAVALSMSLIIVAVARIPARLYLKLLSIPISFALFSIIAVVFLQGGDAILQFTAFGIDLDVSREGANLAILLLFRTLGGMSALFFIALTTPMIEMFSVLKSFGMPEILIELSMLIYRYIFVLLDQAAMINNAEVMRLGNSGLKSSMRSFSMLSSVLFLRAWEQGERLMTAMDSRCYDGHLGIMEGYAPITQMGLAAVTFYIITIAAIALLTREVRLI